MTRFQSQPANLNDEEPIAALTRCATFRGDPADVHLLREELFPGRLLAVERALRRLLPAPELALRSPAALGRRVQGVLDGVQECNSKVI